MPCMKRFLVLITLFGALAVKALQQQSIEVPSVDPLKNFRSIKNEAFRPGEKLTFRLHYGLLTAGEGVLEVMPDTKTFGGRVCYQVVGTGETVGAFNWFFKVKDRYES